MKTQKAISSALKHVTQSTRPAINVEDWADYLDFDLTGEAEERRQLEAMVSAVARFIYAIKDKWHPYWLSLLGYSGSGKTYLARRIWTWYRNSEHFQTEVNPLNHDWTFPGQFCFWPKLAGELSSNQGYGRLQELMEEKLVVIDEIGSDRDPRGHIRDCLTRVLTARVGKWTVITSNKTLGEIQRDIDTRISSRMIRDGSQVIDVALKDYAIRKAKV